MEASQLRRALRRLGDRFASAWEDDPALREDVRTVLQSLWNEEPDAPEAAEDNRAQATAPRETAATPSVPEIPREKLEELKEVLQNGAARPAPEEVAAPLAASHQPPPLELVAERCRLKSEACLVAAEREHHLREHPGSEAQPFLTRLHQVIARAKALPDCYLWMCDRKYIGWVEEDGWTILARNFANLADAVALLAELRSAALPDRETLQEALQFVAEAQSAARCGITACNPQQPRFEDRDQFNTFEWLRQITSDEHYYVGRHMRFDDLADATGWEALAQKLADLRARTGDQERAGRQRTALLGKVRYETQRLADSSDDEKKKRWEKIISATCELLDTGLAPSHRELRDLLLPVINDATDLQDAPAPFQLVVRELDSFVSQQERITESAPPPRVSSPEVLQVRQWLAGRSVILIGGDERPNSARALRDALGLAEVVWLATRPHEPMEIFEPAIARTDIALVLLAIRWSSHSYAGIKVFCDRHDKPLVRLPGGYNANQVAAQIVAQCGDVLQAR